jgi:hypothetical protein
MASITFSASNKRGPGKPFVARIVGRDPKFRFNREFLTNPATVDVSPGEIYQERDTDSNMRRDKVYNSDTYYLVNESGTGADVISEDEAYRLAGKM